MKHSKRKNSKCQNSKVLSTSGLLSGSCIYLKEAQQYNCRIKPKLMFWLKTITTSPTRRLTLSSGKGCMGPELLYKNHMSSFEVEPIQKSRGLFEEYQTGLLFHSSEVTQRSYNVHCHITPKSQPLELSNPLTFRT